MHARRLALIATLLAAAAPAAAQTKGGALAVEQTEAVVTVTKVDPQARTVTFRGPKGGVSTLMVPPEAQNLDQVKPGQQYRMKYVESVAVEIQKGGKASASAAEEMNLAPKGAKPGGVIVRTRQIAGVIDAIDYANRYVAVRGPKGNVLSFKVADDVKLDQIAAGDSIVLTHTEALAIEMVAQAPAKPKK
jgi:Cu/Ag efflux protein CusF